MKRLIVFFAAMTMLFAFVQAQATADIYGTALLPDGSAIPGVAVTLTGDVVGTMTTVTSEEGNYRFLQLAPGNYELKFELEGFKTVIRKNIRLYVAKNITMNVAMETTTIKEEIIVTQKPGAIDTRRTTIGVNVSEEMLQALPTARNPWTVMDLIPGMLLDRVDVGGNESGQQSSFYGHGGSDDDSTWTVDGANVTDPSAIGAAPAYLNVNAYEELQVTLGSNDITAQTGGVQLNFVSKRAGNRYSGDFHLYIEDEAWEMTQDLPDSIIDSGWGSPGIFRLYQYGVNFGGPIIKDKWWWYGSWAVQDIHSRKITLDEDATWLVSSYLKTNFQVGNTSGELHMAYDAKLKWGRYWLGAGSQDATSAWDQKGPGYVYAGHLQHVFGNLMLNAKFGYTDGGFEFMPQEGVTEVVDGKLEGMDMINYGWTYFGGGTPYRYITNRNTINLSLNGNYFMENALGGDHEIRFGVDYYHGDTTSQYLYPNQRWLYANSVGDSPSEVWWYANSAFDVGFDRISFYLSDTVTFGRLTANIGLRWDQEKGSHNEASAPALTLQESGTPIFTDYMGDLTQPSLDIDAAFSVFSPRLSFAYDITGDGKNVVKLAAARYGSQSGNSIANHTWIVGIREIDTPWTDLNSNGVPDIGEFPQDISGWNYWNINEQDPYNTVSRNQYADDLNSPLLDEISLGFEKALMEDLAVSVTGFYKRRSNQIWERGIMPDGSLETADNYYVDHTHTFVDGSTRDVYYRTTRPQGEVMMNHGSDWYDRYLAMQLVFSKKFSNRWMLDASFTYSDWKAFRDADEYIDTNNSYGTAYPGNFSFFNEGVVAPEAGGSGLSDVFINARWQFKLSGLYQLPYGINITTVFTAREGYVIPYYERVYVPGGLSWQDIYKGGGSKMGSDRLPTFWMLNLGLEKTFKISDTATATIFVDGYNITNNTTTLKVQNRMDQSDYDQILRILNPGIFQFGIRVNF